MTTELVVPARPCPSCPYAKATPLGVWHPEEYAKLPAYDDDTAIDVFLCHHSQTTGRDAVCRGWLAVHSDSVAVKVAVASGQVPNEARHGDFDVELYATGREAALAGLSGVMKPDRRARAMSASLAAKRPGRDY